MTVREFQTHFELYDSAQFEKPYIRRARLLINPRTVDGELIGKMIPLAILERLKKMAVEAWLDDNCREDTQFFHNLNEILEERRRNTPGRII